VLEPQGTLFFFLLMAVFAGLVTWLVRTRLAAVRVLAALLAFIPAAVFGIAAVNRYYDYYQTWGSLFSDITGSGASSVPQLALGGGKAHEQTLNSAIRAAGDMALAPQQGYLFRSSVTGRISHITRDVYVYLPPQYFQRAYKGYRFPAIELLHGAPGVPTSWVNVLNLIPTYLQLLEAHQAAPAVLVLPDTDGSGHYSLQCLNIPHGPMDMTWVGAEVPEWASRSLRIMPPGPAWGIAGYSEGGYCAANIGLQDAQWFGYVGSMSGYFAPIYCVLPARDGKNVYVNNVFAGHPRLEARNTPFTYIRHFPRAEPMPSIWLAAGGSDHYDVQAARVFRQLALARLARVPLVLISGGGHQAMVWRNALPLLLKWMTPQLSQAVGDITRHDLTAKRTRLIAASHLAR
jgi:hypothetical protein